MLDDLQKQFTLERQNEQFYRALASAADVVNWFGAKKYFESAADDEQSHALRVREYLIARNEYPKFEPLEPIPFINGSDYKGMFELAMGRENITTASLREKYMTALKDDPQTAAFLASSQGDWPGFLQEQTDSERELNDIIISVSRLSMDGIQTFDLHLAQ